MVDSAPGRAGQMNAGASITKGRLLWFLHADTLPELSSRETLAALSHEPIWGRFNVRIASDKTISMIIRSGIFRVLALKSTAKSTLTKGRNMYK